jgi:hypothetical protein
VTFGAHVHQPTLERVVQRHAELYQERAAAGVKPLGVPTELPSPDAIAATRELVGAVRNAPPIIDQLFRHEIVAGIRDGLLYGVGPKPLDTDSLRPLIERLPEEHRAVLLAPSSDDEHWTDRVWGLVASFEDDTVSVSIVGVRD